MLQPFFEFCWDAVARLYFPFVEPDAQAVHTQSFRKGRTTALSLELWLRNTSNGNESLMGCTTQADQKVWADFTAVKYISLTLKCADNSK